LYQFADINFMHVAILLFLICVIVLVVVSLFTEAPTEEKIEGLTYHSKKNMDFGTPAGRRKDAMWTAILIAIVAFVMIYFTG